MHRAFHVPNFVHEQVHHFADSYADCLQLAKDNSTAAVSNQHSLQYFALDVYSRKTTRWGCIGEVAQSNDSGHANSAPTATESGAPAPAETSASAAGSEPAAPSQTAKASSDCHTHADGSIHCGTH